MDEVTCGVCGTKLGVAFSLPDTAVNHVPIHVDMGRFVIDMTKINYVDLLWNPRRRALLPAIVAMPLGGNPDWEAVDFKRRINEFINCRETYLATKEWILKS